MSATTATNFTCVEAKGSVPVVGNLLGLLRSPRQFLLSLADQGDLVWVRIGQSKNLVVCHPELTHQVLVNDRVFEKGGLFVDRLREFIGDSVSTCPRSEHRRLRRLMQPAFHHGRLPSYGSLMVEETATVVNDWQDGQVLDVYATMQDITTRITARTLFASPASTAVIDDAHQALNAIMAGAGVRMLIPPPLNKLPTPGKRRYDRARARIREITDQLIADYRRAGVDHNDLMSMLLTAGGDDKPLSEQEISDQVVTLFLGGVETVASTLGWALCLLAQRPDIAERLYQEIDAAEWDKHPTLENLSQLKFTQQIITETLRIYPPGWLLTRITTTDTELGGHPIPKGTNVVYSPYLLHRRQDLFEEPDRFDPDRWGADGPGAPRGALVPFGDGPRKCIGDNFTMIEAPLILAMIAARWQIQPVEKSVTPKQHMSLLLTPRNQRVRVKRVSKNPYK